MIRLEDAPTLYLRVRGAAAAAYHGQRDTWVARRRDRDASPAALERRVAAFNAKTVIFTVTTGRSGSDTLSRLFACAPDTTSLHEPSPQYRYILARAQREPALAGQFFRNIKAPSILGYATPHYAESSHLFCKGFLEPALADGFRPKLVMLTRAPRAAAHSLLKKQAVPGRTHAGVQYLIAPDDPTYLRLAAPETLSDYQLCYWYCLEIALRQRLYAAIAAQFGVQTAQIATEALNDANAVAAMFETLGLTSAADARARIEGVVGKAFNTLKRIETPADAIDFDAEEAAVRDRLLSEASADDVLARVDRLRRRGAGA